MAIVHFLMLSATSVVYFTEKKSFLAIATLIIVLISWLIYFLGILAIGIGFPEAISKLILLWIINSGLSCFIK